MYSIPFNEGDVALFCYMVIITFCVICVVCLISLKIEEARQTRGQESEDVPAAKLNE